MRHVRYVRRLVLRHKRAAPTIAPKNEADVTVKRLRLTSEA
jgi:hypothetical protein